MKTIILPGLGASSEMYSDQHYHTLKDVSFINWPIYGGEVTITEFANKVIQINQISKDHILGGSSLGGIVALEIAKIVKAKKVLLIGSTKDSKSINPILKSLGSLTDYTPIKLIQTFAGNFNNNIIKMFSLANPDFIRAACKALSNWQGSIDFGGEIYQIHGGKDHIIKPPSSECTMIPYSGHLIAISHPKEVSAFINQHTI